MTKVIDTKAQETTYAYSSLSELSAVSKVLNVTGMNEQHATSGPVHAYTYGYDALDRLTSATYPSALGLPVR